MPRNHIMVDIETTGTDPDHAAIVQLAAVAFDFETRELSMKMFDRCLLIPQNRYWDENTRDWWSQQPQHILQGIWSRMEDPATVLNGFTAWVNEHREDEPAILWAKPTLFEFPFLASYFRQFNVPNPFWHSTAQDLRSWCRARGLPSLPNDIPVQGDAHNALHDVLHQIQVLFTLLERTDVQIRDAG